MCSDCSTSLHSRGLLKAHVVVDSSVAVAYPACKDHPDKKIEFYCSNTSCNTLACSSCVAISHRDANHKVTDIPSAARAKRDTVVNDASSKYTVDINKIKESNKTAQIELDHVVEEIRILQVKREQLETDIYERNKIIQELTTNINIVQLACNEPSDIDMLNSVKFTSLVTAINHHYGLSIGTVGNTPTKSIILNDQMLPKVDELLNKEAVKLGKLLVQITSDNSNGSWEPIKKVLLNECTTNNKRVLLIARYWCDNGKKIAINCSVVSNWHNDVDGFSGNRLQFVDDGVGTIQTESKRCSELQFNKPGVFRIYA